MKRKRISLQELAMRTSERTLAMPLRWFTGQEWANGTAACMFRRDYLAAMKRVYPHYDVYDAKETQQQRIEGL